MKLAYFHVTDKWQYVRRAMFLRNEGGPLILFETLMLITLKSGKYRIYCQHKRKLR